MTRFSKASVLALLQQRAEQLESEFGFVCGQGWASWQNATPETLVAFGRYSELQDLIEEWRN